jgi:atlastin
MRHYFADVVTARASSDLQGTRDQITKCFEKVSCFLLPHPGPFVTKKNFNGSISKIDAFFRAMLSRYVHVIFDECIEPKRFNGREITAPELLTFFGVYTKMFGDSGGSKFPKAMTMLEATSEANNRNAYDLSIASYRASMDKVAGPDASFVKENELLATHRSAKDAAISQFNSIANMGAQSTIDAKRDLLVRDIESDRNRFFELNSYRNPFRNVEFIIIPLIVAVVSFILAKLVDVSCSTDFCERAEDGLQNIYLFIFFGIIVMSWRQISGSIKYFRDVMPIAMNMAK